MVDNPYLVSQVRVDGKANTTIFSGYCAESCAFRYFKELKDSKFTQYATIIQDQLCRDGVARKFEILSQYQARQCAD